MKNIVALGICLAAFNVYAQDIDNRPNQEMSSITIDAQTRQVADEKMVTTESAVQETYPVTMKNANGEDETVAAPVVTLMTTKEIFNSQEAVEFLATRGLTPDEAFDSIVNLLGQIQNKTVVIDGNTIPVGGVSFAINYTPYFIKVSEFATLYTTDSVIDAATTSNDNSDLNS